MAIDPNIPLAVRPFRTQDVQNPLLAAQQVNQLKMQQAQLEQQPIAQQLMQERVNQLVQGNQLNAQLNPLLAKAQQLQSFNAEQTARKVNVYDISKFIKPDLDAGNISSAKKKLQLNIKRLGEVGLPTEDSQELLDLLENNQFDQARTAINSALKLFATGTTQFGAQQTFKDKDNNLYFGTTARNPSTGEINTVLAPIGSSPAQPVGQVQLVSGLGLTAEEKVIQKGKEAAATEKGKLVSQGELLPTIRADIKKAETQATEQGAELTSLQRAQAALPGLKDVVNKLKTLADVATYTTTGKGIDVLAKELGFGATKGATARAKMISIVDNQVLPLLRDTFGSAFTEREGESLRKTLLDPNAAPETKKETLDVFIEQKIRNIESSQRELGITPEKQKLTSPGGIEFTVE
jgi:hypothetical protein